MPPWASGPVLTVSSPIRIPGFSAIAGSGRLAASAAALLARNLRRPILGATWLFPFGFERPIRHPGALYRCAGRGSKAKPRSFRRLLSPDAALCTALESAEADTIPESDGSD